MCASRLITRRFGIPQKASSSGQATADGRATETLRVSFDIRYVFMPEMELLLRVAGYSRWSVRPLGTSYTTADAAAERPLQEGDILWWTAWKD